MGEPRQTDEEGALARLLSGRRGLSRGERASVLADVLADVEAMGAHEEERPRSWFSIALAFAIAAALVLVVGMPVALEDDVFTARGAKEGAVHLEVFCAGGPRTHRCPAGTEVLFEVANAGGFSHLALFSFRPDDTVVWYVPDEPSGRSVKLPPGAGVSLLPIRAHLDGQHPPGRYEVVGVFSTRPLSRGEVRTLYAAPPNDGSVVLVTRQLEVR